MRSGRGRFCELGRGRETTLLGEEKVEEVEVIVVEEVEGVEEEEETEVKERGKSFFLT